MRPTKNKNVLVTTCAALTLATAGLTSNSADAKPRQANLRQQQLMQPTDTSVDDRYPQTRQGNEAYAYAPVQSMGRAAGRKSARNVAPAAGFGFASVGLVSEARRYLGTNPTGMGSLWCARFMNMVLERSGRQGTGSNMASSFASFGRRVSGPQVGAIAVMSRGKRGGHVGIVSGIDASGNPIIISGNHNKRVAESVYPRGRVYAYVMP